MFQWISDHVSIINVVVNIFTLVFWIFYANILVAGFRRQRSSLVIIDVGAGRASQADCVISNMSREAIYVQEIILSLYTDNGEKLNSVAFFGDMTDHSQKENAKISRGPLDSSGEMKIGTFREMVIKASRNQDRGEEHDDRATQVNSVEITVISFYGPSASIGAAQRTFRFDGKNRDLIAPTSIDTLQLNRWWQRRRVRRWASRSL